ncbi:hypothetical protein RDWZM_002299 [Blomia tropicalis]|uniref:Uncharacterized protein n=1 Tax=Blomia tropicalis TaxID=40697 RepID=A0A9Q0MDL8_BLOTA|nr:hypothetical protein BLOT_001996 [Blomia tropicalis]KAJ6223754.1 hypothetical protein RDWZM_002299 [Blomia tropicalis]
MSSSCTNIILIGLIVSIINMIECQNRMQSPRPLLNGVITNEQRTQLEEMQKNWTNLRKKMCAVPSEETIQLEEAMNSCNKINHVFRIQQLLKPCHLIKATIQASNTTSYLDFERAECQFEECHMKVLDSPEYMEIMADLEKISMEERMAKAFERYKCISNALEAN